MPKLQFNTTFNKGYAFAIKGLVTNCARLLSTVKKYIKMEY